MKLKNRIERLENTLGSFANQIEYPDYENMSLEELRNIMNRYMFEKTLEHIETPVDIEKLLKKVEAQNGKSGFDKYSDFTMQELIAYRYIFKLSMEDEENRGIALEEELKSISEVATDEELEKVKKWYNDLERDYINFISN